MYIKQAQIKTCNQFKRKSQTVNTMMALIYLAALVLILCFLIDRSNNYWKKRGIPFDKPFLFFGSLFPVVTGKQHMLYRIRDLYNHYRAPYVGLHIFTKPYLMIRDLNMIKTVLVKDSEKFLNRNIASSKRADPITYHALFPSKDAEWKQTRSKMSPVFTSGKLKLMFPLIKECAMDLKNYLERNNGKAVEVRPMTKKFTVDVISSCAFGINANCLKNEDSEIMKMATQLFDFNSIKRNLATFCYMFLPSFVHLFKIRFLDREAADYFRDVFQSTTKEREERNIVRNDLIDLLKNLRKTDDSFKFDDVKLASQAITFFSAGNDTTSSMMTFTLYELAVHKDIQDRLREEVRESFEANGGFTYESIQELKYLDMVFNEALRMYPLTVFLDRVASTQYTFEETGLTLEKGTPIMIPIVGLHFDPEYFPEPDKFDPERFNDENKKNIKPYTFLPFGEGPRICIGQRFAYLVSKIGLAYAIKDFSFEPAEETKIPAQFEKSSVFLASADGVPIKVNKI